MAALVLVVEDDDDLREAEIGLVSSFGYRVVSATNGREALTVLAQGGIDAILTDVVMPEMNGFQLAEQVRTTQPEMPIICVTGYANVREDERHCDILLRKPYRGDVLQKLLARVLAK